MPAWCAQAQLCHYCITAAFRHKLTATAGTRRTSEMNDPFCAENWKVLRDLLHFYLIYACLTELAIREEVHTGF